MHQEFTQLVQGDMIVDDYEAEFDRVALFVPSLVPDDEAKRNKFEFGLAMYLKKGIDGSTAHESYEELVERAKKLEAVHQEARAYAQANQKKRNREGENKGQAPRGSAPNQQALKSPAFKEPKGKQENRGGYQNKSVVNRSVVPKCERCGKNHPTDTCRWNTGACFHCGEVGHRIAECPHPAGDAQSVQGKPTVRTQTVQTQTIRSRVAPVNSQGQQKNERPRVLARAYALTHKDAQAVGTIVSGTLPIPSSYGYVLFDSGATHSFVSSAFAALHCLPTLPLDYDLCVSTPIGKEILANRISKMCPVRIGNREILVDLILLEMSNFDVILGMDWLSTHYALVDCNKKVVTFEIPREEKFCFEGSGAHSTLIVLSAIQACRHLRQGCKAFLASVVEVNDNDMKIENVPIVREFADVFPEDLPGLPPSREVEFTVNLAPRTAPISKAPYRMAPLEMKELKNQLEELLEKGFVRPSVSP
ncbi:uncharacterized protein LOC143850338 [Tasmannia lanceolata]|uniref:uncharacterized protein LOC143850338 n=1 Tax=Tasmannia lanceolata TaxID=3420 RepID=UPI004063BFBA